ncbi:hypothetical protein EBR21_06340, partial [bacterium]|nr:hypothetical protein [bacterium]
MVLVPMGLYSLVSCGDKATQFSSPDSYRVSFSMSGTGVDRAKQLAEQASKAGADGVVLESGMTAAEDAQAAEA